MSTPLEDVRRGKRELEANWPPPEPIAAVELRFKRIREGVIDAVVIATTKYLECLVHKRYDIDGHERTLCRDVGSVLGIGIGHMEITGTTVDSIIRFYGVD